ncbi:adenylosuccinate lyase [Caldiplasma sukawensis]
MVVSPIDTRYGRPEIRNIFEKQNRFNIMLNIEYQTGLVQMELGIIPKTDLSPLENIIKKGVDIQRVDQLERITKHDIMSFLRALEEQSGHEFNYLHFGLTSNDLNDSATAIQLKQFLSLYKKSVFSLQETLMEIVRKYRDTPMLGRTHGQHASPITFGLKMAVYLSEINRHIERIRESEKRIIVGKLSGPVGTGAAIGKKYFDFISMMKNRLHIDFEGASGQIVTRDRYVEFLFICSNIATTLEKIGTEIRNLQRPEINEVMEDFDEKDQVGSSSMPSKRNPVESENVCSLSRFIRAMIMPEMETAVTWHERDLTNSALERFTIPYTSILIDYVTVKMEKILRNLRVFSDRMMKNLLNSPLCISERLTVELTRRGVNRTDAHEMIREISMNFYSGHKSLLEIIMETKAGSIIGSADLKEIINPVSFTGNSRQICDMIIEETKNLRSDISDWGN